MENCIFCKIINNELPSYTVYEDEQVKVFLDINPSTDGDLLLIPKKHIVTVDEVDNDLMLHFLKIEKEIYNLLKDKLNCEGLTIVQNNGYGQEVKHLHIHLTPRYTGDLMEHLYNKDNLGDIKEVFEKLTN